MTGKEIAQKMLEAVKSVIDRSLTAFRAEFEKRLAEVPSGPQGEKGEPGAKGDKGEPGEKGVTGDKGEAGATGKSAYALACESGFIGSESQWVASLRGDKGVDGKDGTNGNDGEDGLDALEIEPIVGIDETKRYMRGTWAAHKGGLFRAYQTTEGMNGWECVVKGIDREIEAALDDGRTLKRITVYSDGTQSVREFKTHAMIYRGVWKEAEMELGDVVTWGGSAWHCQEKTTDKPGTSTAWKLMVKEGRPGKDGKVLEPQPHKPVRV